MRLGTTGETTSVNPLRLRTPHPRTDPSYRFTVPSMGQMDKSRPTTVTHEGTMSTLMDTRTRGTVHIGSAPVTHTKPHPSTT